MKKRKFLSPLAVSVAALVVASPVSANTVPTDQIKLQSATEISKNIDAAVPNFILERSNEATVQMAYHRSHYSHRSHSSHRSHMSSRF